MVDGDITGATNGHHAIIDVNTHTMLIANGVTIGMSITSYNEVEHSPNTDASSEGEESGTHSVEQEHV